MAVTVRATVSVTSPAMNLKFRKNLKIQMCLGVPWRCRHSVTGPAAFKFLGIM